MNEPTVADRVPSGEADTLAESPIADRLTSEMRVQFDADELSSFFEAFDPLENPIDPPPRQLPDRSPRCDTAQAA